VQCVNANMPDYSIAIDVDRDSFKSLAGKTVIVTGASSGIGLETAELFYELGSNVVFVGGRRLPTTIVPLDSPRVLICQCDIGSWDSQVDVFAATVEKFGTVDIVCPNAGVAEPQGQYFNLKLNESGRPLPLDLKVVDVDMKGTAYSVALAFHYLKEKGGSVIIVSSRAGYGGMPEMPSYSASKHGRFSFTPTTTCIPSLIK
jgi:NAD(P)-dependent dehydrogenase (short-subunit alcohol dehydrogenase family)